MTVKKINGWWVACAAIRSPSGQLLRKQKKAILNTKASALDLETKLKQQLIKPQKSAVGFQTLASDYMSLWCKVNNRPSTQNRNESILRTHLIPFFGKIKNIEEITSMDIERFKAQCLRVGLSPKSVNMNLGVLKKMFNCAIDWEMVESAPKIKPLRVAPQKFEFLDFEESRRLIDSAWGQWEPMIIAALHAGLRRGELRALMWDDLDLIGKKVVVRRAAWNQHIDAPKSNKEREIPLTTTLCEALKKHGNAAQARLEGLVFPAQDGGLIHTVAMTKAIKRIARKAGLTRIGGSWHCLRHTFASHLVMRGAPIRTVQELGGWADLSMVLRYSHLTPDHRREVIGLLDDKTSDICSSLSENDLTPT